jgi:spore coat protein U-like protein
MKNGLASLAFKAATATTTFQVIANVQVTCLISATGLNFGDYTAPSLSAQSTITVGCTNTAQWNVGLNAGTAPGATVTTRQMTGPAPFFLNYSLSSDPAHTINWGNTVGTDTVAVSGMLYNRAAARARRKRAIVASPRSPDKRPSARRSHHR